MRTVYLGTSAFAAAVLRRLAASEHRPRLVVTRPDRPAGRGRRLSPPPVADTARELGLELLQPENVNDEQARARIAAAGARRARHLRVRRAHQGAAAQRPPAAEHPPVAAAALARGGARRARDHGRRRRDRRRDHAPDRGLGQRADLPHGDRADRARPTRTGRSRRACRQLGSDLLLRALDERPDFAEQPEEGVTYAEKIGPADRTLDPEATAAVNDRVVRALTPHIGARVVAARRRVARRPARRGARPRAARARCAPATTARCCSAASSCSRSSPPAAGRWTPPRTCAATDCAARDAALCPPALVFVSDLREPARAPRRCATVDADPDANGSLRKTASGC